MTESGFGRLAGRLRVFTGAPAAIAGAGIQLTGVHVLTCWHVVHDRAGAPRAPLAVDTPLHPGRPVPADLIWSAEIGPREEGDLALLRTAQPLPSPAAVLADRGDEELEVRVVGYPGRTPTQVVVRARLVGPADPETGWRQLDQLSTATVAIEGGFSGAAAFDRAGTVVGMVVARLGVGSQVVAWMLPVRQWARLLPAELRLPLPVAPAPSRPVRTVEPRRLSFADKVALAQLLAEVPVLRTLDRRQLVVDSLPPDLGRAVQSFGALGLDMFGLVRTALEFHDGLTDLYRVLLALEGPSSRSLQAFRDHAESLGLLTDLEEGR